MADEIEEKVEAQAGVLLAHTALFAGVLGVLRQSGALTQAQVNQAFDIALVGLENAPEISPEVNRHARGFLDGLAAQMAGPRRRDR